MSSVRRGFQTGRPMAMIRDHYVLPIPPGDVPTRAWTVQVALVNDATTVRLPVSIDGAPVGDAAHLTTLRIPGALPDREAWGNPATPLQFGEFARLQEARIEEMPDGWRVSLLWESQTPLPADYTVFVHAYAATGELLATGDGPPQGGHFPTSLWQPGDRILDVHGLPIPAGSVPARIAVGLYHPITGERLTATFDGEPLADNAVVIWKAQP